MQQYPIWNDIKADSYKSAKSFGSRNGYTQQVKVGTSRSNSHLLASIKVTRDVQPDGTVFFRLLVDERCIAAGTLDDKAFKLTYGRYAD